MIATLESITTWAAHASLGALPLAVAVLLLARCRFCPPNWRAWIAALFFVRLTLPSVPETAWNTWSVKPAHATLNAVPAVQRAALTDAASIQTPGTSGFRWSETLPWLWLAGALVAFAWLGTSHLLTRRWILRNRQPSLRWFEALAEWARERQGVTQRVPVVIVRGLGTMAIFGWVRPQLIIPADLADRYTAEQIRGMLLHEFAHVRRRDVLWTWLALLVCALHWFNPLAWFAFRRFCADRELICDAAALETLGESGRFSYGDALLRSLDVKPLTPAPSLAPFFRIHPEIKHRILMITKPLQPTAWSRFAAALLVPALSLAAFTTSRAQSETERPSREGEKPRSESREGERTRSAEREGERPRNGETKKESELDKYHRENAERKARAREGGRDSEGARDGERSRSSNRDGEMKREGNRDGERPREGARDGESRRSAERDGERPREGARDGENRRRGEGEMKRGESSEGRARRSAERDGDRPREGARDGEGRKSGPRDGEVKKEGPRDGEARKEGPRDGERSRRGDREGERSKSEGESR